MEQTKNNYTSRKQFIEAAQELWKPIINLTTAWENLSSKDNGETAVNYPFNGSFDEWIYEYSEWLNKLSEKFLLQTEDFEPTIMVKDLKAILNELDDDIQIVVSNQNRSWWFNIGSVELPDEDNGSFTLTFHTKNDFDTRQF